MLPFGHHAKTVHKLFLCIDQVLFSQIRNHIVPSKTEQLFCIAIIPRRICVRKPALKKMPGDVSAAQQAGKAAGVAPPTP